MSLVYSPFSWADSVYGTTNNAAVGGPNWSMGSVLPDYSGPNVSLQINGLTYYYVITKDAESDATVYVRNEDTVNGGYIFEEIDDWSGLPGNSIQKYFRFPGSDAAQWGDGSISLEGDGTITDPSVIYLYRMDIAEQDIICTNPLASPECPGYLDALYKYLSTLEDVSVNDPYYDEWVQAQLQQEIELEDEQAEQDDAKQEEEDDLEQRLQVDPEVGGLIDADLQDRVLYELAAPFAIEPYIVVDYPDVLELTDTLQIEDTTLPDNNRAMRQLASDAKHYSMVRSQYDREQ